MKILTKEIEQAFVKQGDTSQLSAKDIKIVCKLFKPVGAATWYLYERDTENPDIFWAFANLGDPMCAECGTVSLSEMMALRLPFGLKIERDMGFPIREKTLKEVMDIVKGGGHV